jgi:hypothetical protein
MFQGGGKKRNMLGCSYVPPTPKKEKRERVMQFDPLDSKRRECKKLTA